MVANRLRSVISLMAVVACVGGVAVWGSTVAGANTTRTSRSGELRSAHALSAQAGLAAARAAVAQGYSGTNQSPPTTGPRAVKGKKIWIISCGQALPGCSLVTAGITQAGKRLGWKMQVFDGKGDPSLFNQGIRDAIAAKASGIMLVAMDCPLVKTSLLLAKKAHIPVVAPYSFDCSDPLAGNSQALFTHEVNYGTHTIARYFERWGALQADYVVAKTNGHAKILELNDPEYLFAVYRNKGFDAEIKRVCPGCTIEGRSQITVADLSNGGAAQIAQTLLAQHADATVFVTAYDAMLQAIATSITPDVHRGVMFIGDEGFPTNIGLIKQGVQQVAVAMPVRYIGWAGADTMNRVLAGSKQFPPEGTGYEIIDKSHNLPAGDLWQPKNNYQAAYAKVWAGK